MYLKTRKSLKWTLESPMQTLVELLASCVWTERPIPKHASSHAVTRVKLSNTHPKENENTSNKN